MRSPEPSGFIVPIWNWPPDWRVIGDEVALGRPDRRRVAALAVGDALRAAAARAHHVELRLAAAIDLEHDAASRPASRTGEVSIAAPMVSCVGCCRRSASRIDIGGAAVARPRTRRCRHRARSAARTSSAPKLPSRCCWPAAELEQVDLRIAVLVVRCRSTICWSGEKRGVSASDLPERQVLHIGAVLIHDGEPLACGWPWGRSRRR